MLTTLAIANYRSLLDVKLKLGQLNLITGANGSGKSNLYRAMRLLAETAQNGIVHALAHEGGLESVFWAGPEAFSREMLSGEVPIQSVLRKKVLRLKMGFASQDFGYAISLGFPPPEMPPPPSDPSLFVLDPEIKHETIWHGGFYRPNAALVTRENRLLKIRDGRSWQVARQSVQTFDSMFSQSADPERAPEIFRMRESIHQWRFYDHFRTDASAPARQPQLGTRTPILHHDGRDLAAALRTIHEIGDRVAMEDAISDAFPGAKVEITQHDGRFVLHFYQHGLLRPLSCAELSDGTLRYLLWVAALLTPRPPPLMVLNEPENSLHPDLLPALANLIIQAAQHTQVWVVSHAQRLIASLKQAEICHTIALEKSFGQTKVLGQEGLLDKPTWHWPD